MSTIKLLVNRNKKIKETQETVATIFKTLISEVELQMQYSNCFIMNLSTGVGKSTDFIYELYSHFLYHKVICSQVTVVNTIGICKYVASSKQGLSLGLNIGYQASEFKVMPTEFHSITYQTLKNTTNRYLMPLKEGKLGNPQRYIIVIDEAHINDVNSQEQMAIIRDLLINKPREQLPFFIIQSASIDVNKYMEYFKLDSYIFAEGTRHAIKELYLDDFNLKKEQSIIKATIQVIETIVKSCFLKSREDTVISKALAEIKVTAPTNILIFITKQKQQLDLEKAIGASNIIKQANLQCISINAISIKKDDQLITRGDNPTPKIFISTNVIETGYTIKNVSFVIDCMKFKFLYQNPVSKVEVIRDIPIDKQMQQQRRGRVGRMTPGIYIGICSKEISDALIPKKELQIQVNNLQKIIYSIGVEAFIDLKFMQPVPIEHIFDYIQLQALIGKQTLDAKNTNLINTLINSDIYFKDFRQIILLCLAIIQGIRIIDLIFIFSFMFNSELFKPNRNEYVNDFKQMIEQIYTGKYVKMELSGQISQFINFFNSRGYNIYQGEPWNSKQSQMAWKTSVALAYYVFMFKRKGSTNQFVSKQGITVEMPLPANVMYFVATNIQLQANYICKHIIEISKKEWDMLPCK